MLSLSFLMELLLSRQLCEAASLQLNWTQRVRSVVGVTRLPFYSPSSQTMEHDFF